MVKNIVKNIFRILFTIILLLIIMGAIVAGYSGGAMLKVMEDTNEIDPTTIIDDLSENSVIVDEDGNLIEQIESVEYREIVPADKIPDHLKKAFVAIEDRRFYEHNGVDLIGIINSLIDNIEAGQTVRGGSTITQQLARNVYLNNDVSLSRKLKEIYLARIIDDKLTDDEILEAYLNRVFLGQNSYGVQAASQTYFSKDVWDLTLAEAATLAGVVKGPSSFALYAAVRPEDVGENDRVLGDLTINNEPYKAVYNPSPYERSKQVLRAMEREGYITEEERIEAEKEDVASAINPKDRRVDNLSSYFTDYVKEDAIYKLMDNLNISEDEAISKLYGGGLTIYTTIDLEMQNEIEELVSNYPEKLLGDTSGYSSAPLIDADYDSYGNILSINGNIIYYKKSNLLSEDNDLFIYEDSITNNEDGSITFDTNRIDAYTDHLNVKDYYSYDEYMNLVTHNAGNIPINEDDLKVNNDGTFTISKNYLDSNPEFYSLDDEGNMYISKKFFDLDEKGTRQPQISVVILDHNTGKLKALIGGRDEEGRWVLNRTNMPRQPGSTMKPVSAYITALDNGYAPSTAVDDVPFMMLDGNPWPSNWDGRYRGVMSLRHAIVISENPPAIKTLNDVGIDTTINYLDKLGIVDKKHPERDTFISKEENPAENDEVLSLAIGGMTHGVSNIRLTGAYGGIANYGKFHEPTSISKIVNSNDEVIYEIPEDVEQVIPETVAYQMIDILSSSISENSTYGQIENQHTIGKTGTTSENRDLWFVSSTPYYSIGVWMGADDQNIAVTGTSMYPGIMAKKIGDLIHEGLEYKEFTRPDGIIEKNVCAYSGLLPSDACVQAGNVVTEIFDESNVPTRECDLHVYVTVDSRNNLLATNDTPNQYRANRIFVKRPFDYNPSEFNYTYPEDWRQGPPTQYSELKGSSVETSKLEDGTVRVNTFHEDGSITSVDTKPDGTIITSVYDPNGNLINQEIKKPEPEKPPKENDGEKPPNEKPPKEDPPGNNDGGGDGDNNNNNEGDKKPEGDS